MDKYTLTQENIRLARRAACLVGCSPHNALRRLANPHDLLEELHAAHHACVQEPCLPIGVHVGGLHLHDEECCALVVLFCMLQARNLLAISPLMVITRRENRVAFRLCHGEIEEN